MILLFPHTFMILLQIGTFRCQGCKRSGSIYVTGHYLISYLLQAVKH